MTFRNHVFLGLSCAGLLAACGGSTTPADAGTQTPDTGVSSDAGATCYSKPLTHSEIINAPTSAQGLTKNPTLPLLLPDGGLPPLP